MRVDAVVLRLAAVDRLHVERVAEDEGDAFGGAEVGEPVPGEDALDGDDEVVAIGRDYLEERFGVRRQVLVDEHLAVAVEDADVHGLGVQIDAAVVAVLVRVESHWFSPCADARVLVWHPAYSGWSRRRERPRMRIKVLQLTRPSGAASWRGAVWRRRVCLGRCSAAAGPRR